MSEPDSACNATVSPGDTGLIELVLPTGWQIPGWQCAGNRCRKTFVGTEKRVQERIMLTRANDPSHTSAAYIAVAPSPPIYDYDGHFVCSYIEGKRKCWIVGNRSAVRAHATRARDARLFRRCNGEVSPSIGRASARLLRHVDGP